MVGICVWMDGWIGFPWLYADACGFWCGVIYSAVYVGGGEREGRGRRRKCIYKRERNRGREVGWIFIIYLFIHLSTVFSLEAQV